MLNKAVKLTKIANELDALGLYKLANEVDEQIKREQIRQKANSIAAQPLSGAEGSKNEVLALLRLCDIDPDVMPLGACTDILQADESIHDLVYSMPGAEHPAPYADYTVGDLKRLAIMLFDDEKLSELGIDKGHYLGYR